MCGIFGFIGFECCFKYGIYGLKQLQNRGYDSAGACGITLNNKFVLRKFASTSNLDSITKLNEFHDDFIDCNTGIFHTRWATHGAKNDINAHPHLDYKNRIALVHNGIIENYYDLKIELETNYGIKHKSETDSEVIANLISVYYDEFKNSNNNYKKYMKQAIMKALSRLQGTWALVILYLEKPNKIYCARHGSSLLVGFGGSYIIVTSEQAGFGNHVNNYVCLNNNDIMIVHRDDHKRK